MNNERDAMIERAIMELPDPVDGMNHHIRIELHSRFGQCGHVQRWEINDLKALATETAVLREQVRTAKEALDQIVDADWRDDTSGSIAFLALHKMEAQDER